LLQYPIIGSLHYISKSGHKQGAVYRASVVNRYALT